MYFGTIKIRKLNEKTFVHNALFSKFKLAQHEFLFKNTKQTRSVFTSES